MRITANELQSRNLGNTLMYKTYSETEGVDTETVGTVAGYKKWGDGMVQIALGDGIDLLTLRSDEEIELFRSPLEKFFVDWRKQNEPVRINLEGHSVLPC